MAPQHSAYKSHGKTIDAPKSPTVEPSPNSNSDHPDGVRRGPRAGGGANSGGRQVGRRPGGGPRRLDGADAAGGGGAAGWGRRGARVRRPHLRRPRAQG